MGLEVLIMEIVRAQPEAAVWGVIALGVSMAADRKWGRAGERRERRAQKREIQALKAEVAHLYQRLGETQPVVPPDESDGR